MEISSMNIAHKSIISAFAALIYIFSGISTAQVSQAPNRIQFTNVNIFDGVTDRLAMNTNVLVENNLSGAVGVSINRTFTVAHYFRAKPVVSGYPGVIQL